MMAGLVAIALGQDMAVAGGPFGCHPPLHQRPPHRHHGYVDVSQAGFGHYAVEALPERCVGQRVGKEFVVHELHQHHVEVVLPAVVEI